MEHQLHQGDFIEEHKEESEYKHTILTDGGCENQRESTDGSLNCVGVPTYGCSQLYVGKIEIIFENFVARKISHKHEDEDIVVDNE